MTALEIPAHDADGAITLLPVPVDAEHIPDTTVALLRANPAGQLHLHHYDLELELLQGTWVYSETHTEDWCHQPLTEPDGDAPDPAVLTAQELLTTRDWPVH